MTQDHGPQIKDEAQYEKLRAQGMSQEKAARIANTPRTTAGKRGGASPPYAAWTRAQLYQRAREIGIPGRAKMNKSDLIQALRDH